MVVYLTQWDFGRSWDGRAAPDRDGEMGVVGREDCGGVTIVATDYTDSPRIQKTRFEGAAAVSNQVLTRMRPLYERRPDETGWDDIELRLQIGYPSRSFLIKLQQNITLRKCKATISSCARL